MIAMLGSGADKPKASSKGSAGTVPTIADPEPGLPRHSLPFRFRQKAVPN
jgi:hypothetical protein